MFFTILKSGFVAIIKILLKKIFASSAAVSQVVDRGVILRSTDKTNTYWSVPWVNEVIKSISPPLLFFGGAEERGGGIWSITKDLLQNKSVVKPKTEGDKLE